jgi:hypothetical protein
MVRGVARLDAERLIEGQLQALIDAGENRAAGGIIVIGLTPVERRRRWPELHAGRRPDTPAGRPEIGLVPRLLRPRIFGQPAARGGDQPGARHDLVDEIHRLRLGRRQVLAAQHHGERVLIAGKPRHALRAAGAGYQADAHLRQSELDSRFVGDDAAVAGERQLEGAAERGAVQRRNHRLAAGLQLAEQTAEAAALIEQHGDSGLFSLFGGKSVKALHQRLQQGNVGAARETFLARGDDDALDGGTGRDLRGQALDLVHH